MTRPPGRGHIAREFQHRSPAVTHTLLSPRSRLAVVMDWLAVPWALAHGYLLPPAPRAENPSTFTCRIRRAPRAENPSTFTCRIRPAPRAENPATFACQIRPAPWAENPATCACQIRPAPWAGSDGQRRAEKIICRNGLGRQSTPIISQSPRRGRQRVASGEEAS
jgi:hypothetical protein